MKLFKVWMWQLHVYYLFIQHRIKWYPIQKALRSRLHTSDRVIDSPPITGPISYAVTLHEIGHAYYDTGEQLNSIYTKLLWSPTKLTETEVNLVVLNELLASSWAISRMWFYQPVMGRCLQSCLKTYTKHLKSPKFPK